MSEPPYDVWVDILKHVDTNERLGSCALVSHAMYAAAVAATEEIKLPHASQECCKLVSSWIEAHGPQSACPAAVKVLHITGDEPEARPVLRLPTGQLQQLRMLALNFLDIILPDDEHDPATTCQQQQQQQKADTVSHHLNPAPYSLAALTNLHTLTLAEGTMDLQHLHALTGLTLLQLCGPDQQDSQQPGTAEPSPEHHSNSRGSSHLVQALPALQQLSAVFLLNGYCTDEVLAHLSCLSRLSALCIDTATCTPAALAAIPVGLTGLEVICDVGEEIFSHSSTPWRGQLTGLRQLKLVRAAECQPAVFSSLTGLEALEISRCPLTVAEGEPGLSALAGLTRLTHLGLDACFTVLEGITEADCSALTASSSLEFLGLACAYFPPLASGSLFRSRQLNSLLVLHVGTSVLRDEAAVELLVQACPLLCELQVVGGTKASLEAISEDMQCTLAGLERLPFLVHLEVFGAHITGKDCAAIAGMGRLERLKTRFIVGVTLGDVLQLMACTNLEMMSFQLLLPDDSDITVESDKFSHLDEPWGTLPVWSKIPMVVAAEAAELYARWGASALCQEQLHSALKAFEDMSDRLPEIVLEIYEKIGVHKMLSSAVSRAEAGKTAEATAGESGSELEET